MTVTGPYRWGAVGEETARLAAYYNEHGWPMDHEDPAPAIFGPAVMAAMSMAANDPAAYRDNFKGRLEPALPAGTKDPLIEFVTWRIRDTETEPAHEVPQLYDTQAGPMLHRYAGHVRQDCAVFRRIVARYWAAVTSDAPADVQRALRSAVEDLAQRWKTHPAWREDWSR